MTANNYMLSFMDLLDLDEELIDNRLKSLMERNDHTNKQLKNALLLLQYKQLINIQDNTECENEDECDFIAKLLKNINEENVNCVCDIINTTLLLHTSSVVSKSEHLLQQILYDIVLGDIYTIFTNEAGKDNAKALVYLKVCDTILDAIIESGKIISFMCAEIPIENILNSFDEGVKNHFLSHTVPRLFEGVIGLNILDRLWNYITQLQDKENALKVLCSLSNYYLPSVDNKEETKLESQVIFKSEFWEIILIGLKSNDSSIRKISIYLAKRAIDCVTSLRKNIKLSSENCDIFIWAHKNTQVLKTAWDNFFVLIESLEEKQSNIVTPSLQLFEVLKDFGNHWLEAAFKIGLRHDNTQVRIKCIEHRLKIKLKNECEVKQLLDALNDINLFDHPQDCGKIQSKIYEAFKEKQSFVIFFQTIAKVRWSPIPFYHISDILAKVKIEEFLDIVDEKYVADIIKELMKIPCNNLYIRKAVLINVSYFIGNCCKGLNWRTYTEIFPLFRYELYGKDMIVNNPFFVLLNKLNLENEEKIEFFHFISDHHNNIDFGLLYLNVHLDDTYLFVNVIKDKLERIQGVINRQYYDKLELFKDLVYLMHLLSKTDSKETELAITINAFIVIEYKTIVQYILSLLINEKALSIDDMALLFKKLKFNLDEVSDDVAEILCQLYQASILVLKDKSGDLDKKVLSISNMNYFLVDNIGKKFKLSPVMIEHFNLHTIINFIKDLEDIQNVESTGRLKNVFYEQTCEVVYKLLKQKYVVNTTDMIDFIEKVLDCGGYGCLKWILKIMNEILCILLINEKTKFNLGMFLNRVWRELEELKSNNQYTPCIREFVNLLTRDSVLENPDHNNLFMLHCTKIIELAPARNAPLCLLITELNKKDHLPSHLVYIVSEILLFNPLPRKDQRIIDNVEMEIHNDPRYGQDKTSIAIYHDFHIQYSAVLTLSKINDSQTLQAIITFIMSKIDDIFIKRNRYHGNSQPHRTLLRALQHILMVLLKVGIQDDRVLNWSIEMLGKLPHQPSVRICLEWYISLYYYLQKVTITEDILEDLKLKNVPLQSQFMIMYSLMKHKLLVGNYTNKEYDLIMDALLSHTMGQMFNLRLHAQYLATKLYKLNKTNASKYAYTIDIIERTFIESCKDKNFVKLQNDYYVNDFDIIGNLTPYFIYEILPKYDIKLDVVKDMNFIKSVMKDIDGILKVTSESDFKKEWLIHRVPDVELENLEFSYIKDLKINEDTDSVGTIQKKYIPWKNMADVNLNEIGKKREITGGLIVVASLVDKLPNLGGMARTSEVFGVKTYVVDSLRHLQDKQFQGLSVSAERWIDIEEVRPGETLKAYLMMKKAEGYSVVAAEQTSTSRSLQKFKFPIKTLLLLGHEKEGIPCDLLPMMDYCVEIPQQGFVRSLNVHVTAAIFIWEYARQNIL